MKLSVDLKNLRTVEFGIGIDFEDDSDFTLISVDKSVQKVLVEMVSSTVETLAGFQEGAVEYDPSEKYAAQEYVVLSLKSDYAKNLSLLHFAKNMKTNAASLNDAAHIYCYFAKITDESGKHITAIRRATKFKGILKDRLIKLVTDSLKLIEDKVFKLDQDFDLIIDDKQIHVLRPAAFEFMCSLQETVMHESSKNIAEIEKDIKFIDFSNIKEYALKHARAARYLASIRKSNESKNISKSKLINLCKTTGVKISEKNGKILVDEDNVMPFLEVLERRRYEVELVKGKPEHYKAPSRISLDKRKK